MVNYFKALLPVTTLIDNLLVPDNVDKAFYHQQSFFLCGLHCTAWLKFYIVVTFISCLAFSENIMEEAMYIKGEFYEVGRSFNGIKDLISEWDTDSYSFQCVCLCAAMFTVSVLFIATMWMNLPFCIIPIQIVAFLKFLSLLKTMLSTYVANMSGAYEIYSDMDSMMANLQHFRNRDVWFKVIDLHPRYEPIVRCSFLLFGMMACLVVEYLIERVMQFYGYEKFLSNINRPLLVAYRKYDFELKAAQRSTPQKARLIKHHRNANGNFTWALGNCSLHTAIGESSFLTAIEMNEQIDHSDNFLFHKSCRF